MGEVLVPAWPEVLRAGLPVVVTRASARGPGSGRTYAAVWLGELDGERFVARVCALDNGIFSPGMEQLGDEAIVQVDLRDPADHDAVVRAMLRKLRPGASEPFNAPQFYVHRGDGVLLWWLAFDNERGTRCSTEVAVVPRVSSECSDRALALAACAAAVFEVSRVG